MFIEQLIVFTTDSVGLERILRLVHSLLQIVVSVPILVGYAAALLHTEKFRATAGMAAVHGTAAAMLTGARDRVNLGRRFSRMFRFVESFHGAHQLYMQLMGGGGLGNDETRAVAGRQHQKKRFRADPWLDVFARTFAGIYLLLETATIVDALDVPGLTVWGPERATVLNVEGQRYWFLSLSCSVAATLVRMAHVARDVPMPPPTDDEKQAHTGSPLGGDDNDNSNNDETQGKDKIASLNEERLRLRRIIQGRMTQRRKWQRALQARLAVLLRKVVADGADVLLPGAIVGWTPLRPVTVGGVMLFTTLLTSYDVWLRCGREVAAAKEAEAEAAAAKAAAAAKEAEEKAAAAEKKES